MSKKTGTIVKIVAFVAGVAAVGTACYVYKDKIKEFLEKMNIKDKLNTAKDFVSEKLGKDPQDDFFDDAEFFDEDNGSGTESLNRGYTSITITSEEDAEEDEAEDDTPAPEETAKVAEEPATKVEPSLAAEAPVQTEEEVTPEEYEYEGLSDVSEDEDVLADEAALDGAE